MSGEVLGKIGKSRLGKVAWKEGGFGGLDWAWQTSYWYIYHNTFPAHYWSIFSHFLHNTHILPLKHTGCSKYCYNLTTFSTINICTIKIDFEFFPRKKQNKNKAKMITFLPRYLRFQTILNLENQGKKLSSSFFSGFHAQIINHNLKLQSKTVKLPSILRIGAQRSWLNCIQNCRVKQWNCRA